MTHLDVILSEAKDLKKRFDMNILVCDDDKEIVEAVDIYLSQEGYDVFKAYDGAEALEVINNNDIQLLIIDVMMPKMDGIHAVLELRKKSSIPVIILSAKSEDSDKILGLTVGADDYITKPFNPAEVTARVRSQLRRYTQLGSRVQTQTRLVNGGIELDDAAKEVRLDGDAVSLTPKEYEILKLLMMQPGRVFAPDEIYTKVWGEEPLGAEGTVAVHIRHLREKLEIDPAEPRYIRVVWGQGYRMEKWDR